MSVARLTPAICLGPRLRGLAALLLCLLPLLAGAEPSFPAAGRIGLAPPPGMSESKRFAGFENSGQTASMMIVEMPAVAYAKLAEGMTDAALATKGFVVSDRREALLVGAKSFLAHGTQKAMGILFDKWLLVAGNDELTAIVTVQIPSKESAAFPAAAIEASLHSVVLGKARTLEEQMAALPFRVNDLAGFRVSRALGGSALMLTIGPKDIIDNGLEQPIVIVASGLGLPPAEDKRADFAQHALETLASIKHVEIEDSGFYKKGDNLRHRIRAHAVDAKSGEAIHVVQFIHFLPRGWIRTAAVVRPQDATALGKKVQTLFESIEAR